ncbi:hypothetical protein [Paenibacillus ihumii]|uniref:hypothetical protein n=1 Tax=Paenibacillus ihumii TaxID=687436 RepID=UPI001CA3425E|nr:hypothetical protein [Paenibacillus ihumii]
MGARQQTVLIKYKGSGSRFWDKVIEDISDQKLKARFKIEEDIKANSAAVTGQALFRVKCG